MRRAILLATAIAAAPIDLHARTAPDVPVCRAPFDRLLSDRVFAAYPVAHYRQPTKPVAPDVRRGQAHLFRTALREGASTGPNFAGHFTIIPIGCGAATTCPAIADATSGKVYFPKQLRSATALIDYAWSGEFEILHFRRSSQVLVIVGTLNERPGGEGLYRLRWHHGRLRLLSFIPARKLCHFPQSSPS